MLLACVQSGAAQAAAPSQHKKKKAKVSGGGAGGGARSGSEGVDTVRWLTWDHTHRALG